MDEKLVSLFMMGLQDAVADLIAKEVDWCESFFEKNPTHRKERERDRDLIVFGIREVYIEMKKRWRMNEGGEYNDQH